LPEGVLEQTIRRLSVALIVCLLLPSCAHFTSSGRQQLAYAKYVRKQSRNRVQQQTKFKKTRVPAAPNSSDPKITAGASESPESVTSGESTNQ
jgi:hypothetical protein